MLSLHENNSLLIEGEFNTFDLLDTELGSTDLFANGQLITDLNFDTLLQTTFDGTTGFTTFTAVAEPTNCVLADVDMNGQVDFNDIPEFVTVLLGNTFQCEADCDENGVVDFNDIPFFVNLSLIHI